jgi:hypothetical protein
MTAKVIQKSAILHAPPPVRFGPNTTVQANASNRTTPRGPAPPPTKFGALAALQTKPAPGWLGHQAMRPPLPVTSAGDATVQLMKRGAKGGKAGAGYQTPVKGLTKEQHTQDLQSAGLSRGVQGHEKGDPSATPNRQQQDEMGRVNKARQEREAREKLEGQCETYHAYWRNEGRTCPHCGKKVVAD